MSEQKVAIEFIVGKPPSVIVDEFNRFWEKLSDPERQQLLQGKFEPERHITARPTCPRLDPMTGGELPSREAELRWLSGFQSATCMPSRSKYRRRGYRTGGPYVDFRIF